ncbi:MAG: Smr/MutS family protein [Gammaproteobacteria bacterium]
MSKPPDKQDDDAKLFRQAMSGIRRLQHDKIDPHRRKIRPYPAQRRRDEQQVLAEAMAPPAEAWDIETGEELLYSRDGVQNSVMRKLRRGHYRLEAELDLHRLTAAQAYQALTEFIAHSKRRQLRCVRIIHGKGLGSKDKRPILKGRVNQWLRQWDDVLAFCSARPCDGGSGATYVLLRKAG